MPAVTTLVGPATSGVPSAQLTFGKMWRELLLWNPDLSPDVAMRFIQNSYRRVIDHKPWYGLMAKGVLSVPSAYTTGSVSVTNGSATVTGAGTSWSSTHVGMQFRIGFMQPIYTITAVGSATSLTLDIPWGDTSQSGCGYMIFQSIVNFGPNTKNLLAVVNQRQGYKCFTNLPQEAINVRDTWRASVGWTFMVAGYPASSAGVPQRELYPIPIYQQTFPFIAYVQPPDFSADTETPVPWIRSDVIVAGAVPDAKMFRRNGPYYDPAVATMKQREVMIEIEKMAANDDNSYMRDLLADYNRWPFSQMGSNWLQSHDGDIE